MGKASFIGQTFVEGTPRPTEMFLGKSVFAGQTFVEGIPLEGTEFIRVTHQHQLSAWQFFVTVLALKEDNTISRNTYSVQGTGTSLVQRTAFPLPKGLLISASAWTNSDGIGRGLLFVQLSIIERNDLTLPPQQILASDYLTSAYGVSWPGNQINLPDIGTGYTSEIESSDPSAGINPSLFIASGTYFIIYGATTTLVTSATVANRRVRLMIDPEGLGQYHFISPVDQAASLTYVYSWLGPQTLSAVVNNRVQIGFTPFLRLKGGTNIFIETDNLQAGDNFGRLRIYGELALRPTLT
jgi:hypothetical protein